MAGRGPGPDLDVARSRSPPAPTRPGPGSLAGRAGPAGRGRRLARRADHQAVRQRRVRRKHRSVTTTRATHCSTGFSSAGSASRSPCRSCASRWGAGPECRWRGSVCRATSWSGRSPPTAISTRSTAAGCSTSPAVRRCSGRSTQAGPKVAVRDTPADADAAPDDPCAHPAEPASRLTAGWGAPPTSNGCCGCGSPCPEWGRRPDRTRPARSAIKAARSTVPATSTRRRPWPEHEESLSYAARSLRAQLN